MGRPKVSASPNKRKRTKDENKPKRSTSAYFYFLAHCRERAQKTGKSISKIAEFTKESSAEWREMDSTDKRPFDEKAATDKARYDKEMAEFKGVTVDPNKPKRPQSSYFLFLADFRTRMKDGGLDHKQILSKAGEEWRGMTDKTKEPYVKKSLEEKKKYDVAMAQYTKGLKASAPKKAKQQEQNGAEDEDDDDEEEEDDEEEDDE